MSNALERGLHFYTLNQAEASLAVWNNLKLPR